MLRDPKGPVLPTFSEQRVRMARQVPFDVDDGLDLERLFKQQWDRAESSLDRSLDAPKSRGNVLDAAVRFVALGGWSLPSHSCEPSTTTGFGRTACRRAQLGLVSTRCLDGTAVVSAQADCVFRAIANSVSRQGGYRFTLIAPLFGWSFVSLHEFAAAYARGMPSVRSR